MSAVAVSKPYEWNANAVCSSRHVEKSSSRSHEKDRNGWDFWSKVYSEPLLKVAVEDQFKNFKSMKDLLNSMGVCEAEVLVFNVPRLAFTQQNVIRSLLSKHAHSTPVHEIHIKNHKWRLRFYRVKDALAVQKCLDGVMFRNKKLATKIQVADASQKPESQLKDFKSNVMRQMVGVGEPTEPTWTRTEQGEMSAFKRFLCLELQQCSSATLATLVVSPRLTLGLGTVSNILELWPVALMRACAPEIKCVGNVLCLRNGDYDSMMVQQAAKEAYRVVPLDAWETQQPMDIRTDSQLIEYCSALLSHFGPQNVLVDLPLRLLAQVLSEPWPKTAMKLAERLLKISALFVMYDETIYLVSDATHMRKIAEKFKAMGCSNEVCQQNRTLKASKRRQTKFFS